MSRRVSCVSSFMRLKSRIIDKLSIDWKRFVEKQIYFHFYYTIVYFFKKSNETSKRCLPIYIIFLFGLMLQIAFNPHKNSDYLKIASFNFNQWKLHVLKCSTFEAFNFSPSKYPLSLYVLIKSSFYIVSLLLSLSNLNLETL